MLGVQPVFAERVAPEVLLKSVTLEVIAVIRADKEIHAGNPIKAAELVDAKVLPLFDFARMTQLALAHNWRGVTAAQQKVLIAEFRTLQVRTYTVALSSGGDQPIEFRPLHAVAGDTEVTVKTQMKQAGTDTMSMDYEMDRTPAGWKVFDTKIDGVSLVTTYRETFADRVHEGGIDGLIRALDDKNRESERVHRNGNWYEPIFIQGILHGGV